MLPWLNLRSLGRCKAFTGLWKVFSRCRRIPWRDTKGKGLRERRRRGCDFADAVKSSSRFQDIFQAALKSYQKQTKKNLIEHPLASQLQSCDSTVAIIAILQDQVWEFDKSHSGDERLMRWLSPTMNVISAFSATVSGGVSLVSLNTWAIISLEASSDVYFVGIFPWDCNLHRHWCLTFSKYPTYLFWRIFLTLKIL